MADEAANGAPGTEFTAEEVCEQAKGNAGAAILVLLAYARQVGQPLAAAAEFVGRAFAPGWEEERGKGARVAARWAALNAVSLGGALRDLSGDERRAAATVAGWPGAGDLEFFGLSQDEADNLYRVFGPVAEHLGLRYDWRRDGEAVTMVFEQGEG